MATKFLLKPVGDLLVRLEDASRHLLAEGEDVVMSAYWRKKEREGSVVEAKKPKGK